MGCTASKDGAAALKKQHANWPNALRDTIPDVTLVDAQWLAGLTKQDPPATLPRCQAIPEEAKVTIPQMCWDDEYTVACLVISCPWLDALHPDPKGTSLRSFSFVLEAFAAAAAESGSRVGVFWDYASLPQRSSSCLPGQDDRTSEEKERFSRALANSKRPGLALAAVSGALCCSHVLVRPNPCVAVSVWFGSTTTNVLLVNTALRAGSGTILQPYDARGWCILEQRISKMAKEHLAVIELSETLRRRDDARGGAQEGPGDAAAGADDARGLPQQ